MNAVVRKPDDAWDWQAVQKELETLGHLEGVKIDPRSQTPRLSKRPYFMSGNWNSIVFTFSWVKGKFISLSMVHYDQRIVDAFSTVSGRYPFCSYKDVREGAELTTVEWSWVDEDERFQELKKEGKLNLKRL